MAALIRKYFGYRQRLADRELFLQFLIHSIPLLDQLSFNFSALPFAHIDKEQSNGTGEAERNDQVPDPAPDPVLEEIMEQVRRFNSCDEAAQYAERIAKKYDDPSLYELIVGTCAMNREFGGEQARIRVQQEHQEALLKQLFS